VETFSLHAGTINLAALILLAGIVVVMLIFNSYTLLSNKDKLLKLYNIYLLTSLLFAGWNIYRVVKAGTISVLNDITPTYEWATAVAGLAYIYFFGHVFNLPAAKKIFRFAWYAAICSMCIQIAYLAAVIVIGYTGNFNAVFVSVIFGIITIATLIMLIYAIFLRQKTIFQKIILTGSAVFYILIFLANLQEYNYHDSGLLQGINILFIALMVEHLFFAAATASRLNNIYSESAKLKISNYKYQLEIEQVTGFFSATIHQHDDTGELLWDVAKNLIGKLGFEECMIYLWNSDKTVLLQKAGYGSKGSMQGQTDTTIYHVPKGKGIVGAAAESGKYILANDTAGDKRYFSADGKIMMSELCVPVIHNNEVMGVINTEHTNKGFYTDRHVQILTTIASMLADKIDMIEAQQQTREKEIEVLKLNKDLATSQLTTLRAQMNPHFIFNALNSVQQYILQGNITEANRYLSKFSKLQREVLNHSDQDFISLEKELEVLNLYLELEQLRFAGNFKYEIKADATIDDDEIKIPPMIVQPFVENSIWHGLMPKQGERWVHIHFKMKTDDLLLCTVRDNGIGREAAARIKNSNTGQHKSKGLSLVYDRLSILRQQYGQAFDVTIHDIKDENNLPVGTEVQLEIYTG
jgi:putative methionine-R-sulfoxide reductase with GAF domain/two-component sensor histidine kinase